MTGSTGVRSGRRRRAGGEPESAGARTATLARGIVVGALALATVACGARRGAERSARRAFERGDYVEAVAICRHARRRGVETAGLDWVWGASLLALGRDGEAWVRLRAAARLDPAMGPRVARAAMEAGAADARKGRRQRAAERIARALEFDPALDVGAWAYLLGERAWRRDRWPEVARWYRAAVEARPDTAAAETAWYRLATALEKTGRPDEALEAYETLLARWPRTSHRASVRWRVASLTYDAARAAFEDGDAERTLELLQVLPDYTTNGALLQKQRFLEGEAWEMLGDFERAWQAYHAVIESDLGASGTIVRRAREKLEALREAGIH